MSKQVLTALSDSVFSLALLVVGHFYPTQADFMHQVILAIQPLAAALILDYTSQSHAARIAANYDAKQSITK